MSLRTKRHSPESIWPSEQEKLLLQAALFQGETGQIAASRWLAAGVDSDVLDQSGRLLPLLHQNLKNQSITVDESLAKVLKQRYMQTWGMNKLLFHSLAEILAFLQDAQIPTLLLKGCALTPGYYGNDPGLRPMSDVDILVPLERAVEAMDLLAQNGWEPEKRRREQFTVDYIPISHGHAFRKPGSYQCDLHWHVLPECCRPGDDEDFWQNSVPLEVAGISTRVLNPADQVLHLCLHGARWNHSRSVRWLADVFIVLKTEEMDWPRLIGQADRRRLMVPVRKTLLYLSEHLEAPIPADVIQQLQAAPVSKMEQREYQYQLEDHNKRSLGYLPILWFHYRRWLGKASLWRQMIGFPGYLRRYWGVESSREFFRLLLTMVQNRLSALRKG